MKNNKSNIVVQSNKLVEAHYKQEYTVQEQRTVYWLISEIHKEDLAKDYEHKKIRISAQKYADLMGISVKDVYRDADKIADGLGEKRFTIKTETGWVNFGWISSMEYKGREGIIEALIAPAIIPYIVDLKEKFTAFRLENILKLRSTHAIKLYQLLAQYKALEERMITVDDLRSILGILELKTYSFYGAIKQRILEVAKREINKKTDLTISYSEIKQSRKVVAVKFKIVSKPTKAEEKETSKINITKLKQDANKCFNRFKGNCATRSHSETKLNHVCFYCPKFNVKN